ncbi:MAG TPA: nucleotide sugar dehydrogenase [Anaerolineales bacterium]|nr:nucleotide sugar dehydrogenase [Anaerolineales bacterium]
MNYREILRGKIQDRSASLAVIGLGYVGMPLAVAFAEAGFSVTGIDQDPAKVAAVNNGESYLHDIPAGQICRLVEAGRLRASTDASLLAGVDAVSICVPTPLRKTGDPDLSYVLSVAAELARFVHPGMVIILESTTYPGTTREILLPKLLEGNSLVVGEDFYLAFSPERVDPGRKDWTTVNTPKVIGGITENCTQMAASLYSQALETIVPVTSTEVAEMAKLLENTFRMVNIGLVNEMVLMCDRLGIDIWEVIDAAATKPFGFMKFTPGPGLGGHCIPIDPLYLSWKLRTLNYTAQFIDLASEINTNMPRYVVEKVQDALNNVGKPVKGSRTLILGVAYKADIDDVRESPALDVIGLLRQKGSHVIYNDPYIPHIQHDGWELSSSPDLMAVIRSADCVVIITNHSDYDYPAILEAASLIVDTRNALGSNGRTNSKVVRL